MNVSGVTQTEQILPQTQAPAETRVTSSDIEATTGADSVSFSNQVQTQVMDMSLRQFEQAASELISSMAASTGVGSNVDVSV